MSTQSYHGYQSSFRHSATHHGYQPSIQADTFELDKFDITSIEKECDGWNVTQCESLKRIGIILNKYALYLLQNKKQSKIQNETILSNAEGASDGMTSDLLAIYQQEVYGNKQPMMKL
eukprot:522710_1